MSTRRGRTHPATGRLFEQLTGGPEGSLPALLRGRVAATPAARFLLWERQSWSYAEALAETEQVAGFLREVNAAGPAHRVASYLPNRPEALWTWFGTLLAGSVYVPLNRAHKGPVLLDMLARSGASVLVTDIDGLSALEGLEGSSVRVLVVVDGDPGPVRGLEVVTFDQVRGSARWGGVTPPPHDLASVMYTSGSTGRSKAVMVSHNQQPRGGALAAEAFGYEASDVWHAWPPVFHVMAQVYAVLASMAAGGAIALQPGFSRSRFWRQVHESESTIIGGLASVMRLLWSLPDDRFTLTNTARLALVPGAFTDLHEPFQKRFGVTIADCYGLTEAEPVTLPLLTRIVPGSHGLESPDFEVRIADALDAEVDEGSIGEIVIRPRRAGVIFQGYEGDSEQTVRSWRNLWFHTGDLGFLDAEGYLHFLDRRLHGIRRSGENISTWDLEELLRTVPGVEEAVAVGVPAAPGEEEVKAVIVRKPRAELTAPLLHSWCSDHMAKFMVPRYIEFMDALPRITLGKIDRPKLLSTGPGVWDAVEETRETRAGSTS